MSDTAADISPATICAEQIEPLADDLFWLADWTERSWCSEQERWVDPEDDSVGTFDIEQQLRELYFNPDRGKLIADWVEFNLDSGPQRRERLVEFLVAPFKPIRFVENTPDAIMKYRDLGHRTRMSAEDDAREAVEKCRAAGRYLKEVAAMIAAKPPTPEGDPQWSRPDTPKRWATRFGFSERTMKRHFDENTVRNKRLSDRSYMVDQRDIPKPELPSGAGHK